MDWMMSIAINGQEQKELMRMNSIENTTYQSSQKSSDKC